MIDLDKLFRDVMAGLLGLMAICSASGFLIGWFAHKWLG